MEGWDGGDGGKVSRFKLRWRWRCRRKRRLNKGNRKMVVVGE